MGNSLLGESIFFCFISSMASPSQELQSPSTIIDLEAEEDEDENVIVPEPYASVSNILDANPPSAYLGKRTELQDELTQASLKAMTLAFEQSALLIIWYV